MRLEPTIGCIVAGDANVDLLIDGVTKLTIGAEKLARGMELTLGGSSSITAFNLASMGVRVAFAGLVGDDLFGHYVRKTLESVHVDVGALRLSKKHKSGLTIWHSNGGERAGVTFGGTIAQVRATDVPPTLLSQARHLHVGAYFLVSSFQRGSAALFREARRLGLTTSLDCNYDPAEKWDSGIRKLLRETDIFLPNEVEAMRITGRKTVEKAAQDLAEDARMVAVKLGPQGALVCSGTHVSLVAAQKVRVVDTTGAGDSFNAGFLCKFLAGGDLIDCARAGVAAGSKCVGRRGGTAAFRKQ